MNHLQTPARQGAARILTALLLVGGALIFMPPVRAVNSDWTHEVVGGVSDNVNAAEVAHEGERLGLLYSLQGSGLIGFNIRDASGAWSVKNANTGITSDSVGDCDLAVAQGTTKWAAVCYFAVSTVHHEKVWTSTDDGVTWTGHLDLADSGGSCADDGVHRGSSLLWVSGDVWLMAFWQRFRSSCGTITQENLQLARTSDFWATTSTPANILINDNKANPSQSSATTAFADAVSLYADSTNVYAFFAGSATTNAYLVSATRADVVANTMFWSVPFTSGTCTSSSTYQDSGTVIAPLYQSVGNGGSGGGATTRAGGAGTPFFTAQGTTGDVRLHVGTTTEVRPCRGLTMDQVAGTTCTSGSEFYGTSNKPAVAGNAANTYIAAVRCSAPSNFFKIFLKTGASGSWAASYTDTNEQPTVLLADMTATKAYVLYASSQTGRLELLSASAPTAVAPTPNATMAVSNLVGFDVDPTGGTAIARYDGGTTVGVFSGQSLNTAVQTATTTCVRDAGVTAFTLDVAYVDCDPAGTSHPANFIRIRTNQLDHITTVPLGQCDAGHPLYPGSDDYSLNPDPEAHAEEIRTFQLLSIDFTQAQNTDVGGIAQCRLQAAFGASFETGKVGVLTADSAKCIGNNCVGTFQDPRRIASAWSQYDPAGNPISHMCAVIPITIPGQTSQAAVVAADDSGTTKVYMWNRDTYSPQVNLAESAAGTFSQGRGVGCGKGDRFIVQTATQVAAFNVTSQTQAWAPIPLTGGVPPQRGVAMSYDGNWSAYVDGSNVQLVNMTNGARPSCGLLPLRGGVFKEIRLTEKAQDLYVATSTGADRWDVHACTTHVSLGQGGFDDGCGPTAPTQCPGAGDHVDVAGTGGGVIAPGTIIPTGWTVAAFNGFLGVILMGAMGGGMWGAFGQKSVALVIGAILGFILALLFKLFSLWVLLVVVVISLAIIFLAIKRSAGGASS